MKGRPRRQDQAAALEQEAGADQLFHRFLVLDSFGLVLRRPHHRENDFRQPQMSGMQGEDVAERRAFPAQVNGLGGGRGACIGAVPRRVLSSHEEEYAPCGQAPG